MKWVSRPPAPSCSGRWRAHRCRRDTYCGFATYRQAEPTHTTHCRHPPGRACVCVCASEGDGRHHRIRAAALRAPRSPHLSQGQITQRPLIQRSGGPPRRGPPGPAPLRDQHPDVVGQERPTGCVGSAAERRQRPGGHPDEREHITGSRGYAWTGEGVVKWREGSTRDEWMDGWMDGWMRALQEFGPREMEQLVASLPPDDPQQRRTPWQRTTLYTPASQVGQAGSTLT